MGNSSGAQGINDSLRLLNTFVERQQCKFSAPSPADLIESNQLPPTILCLIIQFHQPTSIDLKIRPPIHPTCWKTFVAPTLIDPLPEGGHDLGERDGPYEVRLEGEREHPCLTSRRAKPCLSCIISRPRASSPLSLIAFLPFSYPPPPSGVTGRSTRLNAPAGQTDRPCKSVGRYKSASQAISPPGPRSSRLGRPPAAIASPAWNELRTRGPAATWTKPMARARSAQAANLSGGTYSATGR